MTNLNSNTNRVYYLLQMKLKCDAVYFDILLASLATNTNNPPAIGMYLRLKL